jgi:glucose 1-dehydrogenase
LLEKKPPRIWKTLEVFQQAIRLFLCHFEEREIFLKTSWTYSSEENTKKQNHNTTMFQNKVAIVTGAGRGIGFEICRKLAEEGAHVILNDLDSQAAEAAAFAIGAETKGSCFAFGGDVSNPETIKHLVNEAVSKFGKLDIAIANAGITLFGEFLTYPLDSLNKVLQLNIAGTFLLAQAAANQMKDQPNGGSLLLMSSVTGHQAHKNLAAYSMSKAAIEMLAKNLVIELSQFKINVNSVVPGATLTERTLDDPEYLKIWSAITPLGKPATVEDIANGVLFLVSDKARHITGQSLIIDGGWTCVSPSPY